MNLIFLKKLCFSLVFLLTIPSHSNTCHSAVFELGGWGNAVLSPDANRYATISDNNVYLWDSYTHQILLHLADQPPNSNLFFSPDGRCFIVLNQKSLLIYDLLRSHISARHELPPIGDVYYPKLSFAADGRYFITAPHGDGTAIVWDIDTGALTRKFGPYPDQKIEAAAFVENSNRIVTKTYSHYQFWDLNSGTLLEDRQLSDYINSSYYARIAQIGSEISRDGKYILVKYLDSSSRLPPSFRIENTQTHSLQFGYANDYSSYSVTFDRNNSDIIYSKGTGLKIWDIEKKILIKDYGHLSAVQSDFNYTQQKMLVFLDKDTLQILDTTNDAILSKSLAFQQRAIHQAAFSPVEPILAQGVYKSLIFYSLPSLDFIRSVSHESEKLAFSPGGETLVSAGPDGSLSLFDVHTGDLLRTLPSALGPVHALAVGPMAASVVTAYATQPPHLWHTDGNTSPQALTSHKGPALTVDIVPTGELYTGGEDRVVYQWNTQLGELRTNQYDSSQPIRSISHPASEKILLIGRADNNAVVIDRTKANHDGISQLERYIGNSDQAAISPDGRWIVVGTLLWNRAENKFVQLFQGPKGIIQSVGIAHDAQAFISYSIDFNNKYNYYVDLRSYTGSGVEDWARVN